MAKTTKKGKKLAAAPVAAARVEPDLPVSNGITDAMIAPAVESVPDATGVSVEPFAQPDDKDAPAPTFTVDQDGHYVAPKGFRELFIRIAGQRYEHVSEMPDGRWVYRAS